MKNKTLKILFIDDTLSMHTLVQAYLEKAGYQCTCASNGEEGLKLLPVIKPDLILLDYMMPGLDGGQVHAELTTNAHYRDYMDIPVIILTAKELNQEIKTRFLEGGISAYLLKPFGMRELTNIIENVFIINDIKRKNIQLQHEIQQTRDYLELLFDTIPMGILSSDRQGYIKKVNAHLLTMLDLDRKESIIGQTLLDNKYLAGPRLHQLFEETLIKGNGATLDCLTLETSANKAISLKLKTTPIHIGDELAGEIIIAQDITEAERRQHELAMLSQISHFMNRTIQLDQLLHLVLTALTAGCAFGFSRAMILLIDNKSGILEGRMGVGPANQEEANRIWTELSKEEISLPNFLEKYGLKRSTADEYFNNIVKQIKMPYKQSSCIFSKIIEEKTPAMIHRNSSTMVDCSDLFLKLKMEEFLAVPLIAQDNVIGVIAADNFFSNRQIDHSLFELLTLFATQAGLAVERAETYHELEQEKDKLEHAYKELKATQERLLHAERLATVGKMAAQIAHEIRNPLVAIGGFAQHILKLTDAKHANAKLPTYAKIITEEVQRLEAILSEVLNFTKLAHPELSLQDINKIIDEVLVIINISEKLAEKSITITRVVDSTIPPLLIDPQQIKQVLINLCQNAIHSMKRGGELNISTKLIARKKIEIKIKDSGEGIPPHVQDEIFNPFFTTKKDGIGLGLPISLQIIHGHGGDISVDTKVGKGTTFTITLNAAIEK